MWALPDEWVDEWFLYLVGIPSTFPGKIFQRIFTSSIFTLEDILVIIFDFEKLKTREIVYCVLNYITTVSEEW
jgi:hypothetical protein